MQGHDDDIRCLAIHPDRNIVATGQVASALDGSVDVPYVCVWDTRDTLGVITRIKFPSEGQSARCVPAAVLRCAGMCSTVKPGQGL